MEVDVRTLLTVIIRRFWILLLIPAIAGATAYGLGSRETPLYAATSLVQVNAATSTGSSDYYTILSGQSQVETNRQLVEAAPVMEQVIQALALPVGVPELRERITVTAVANTTLLQISASDASPALAAAIANAAGEQFARYITAQAVASVTTFQTALDQQITETSRQIEQTSSRVLALQEVPVRTPQEDAELTRLTTELNQRNASYTQLTTTSQMLTLNAAAAQTQVVFIEQAAIPIDPYAPRVGFRTILGLIAGLLIALSVIFILEYFDNTVKASTNYAGLFGAPLLAGVEKMGKLRDRQSQLFGADKSRRRGQEAIRLLRTNLEFAVGANNIRSLAICSTIPGEGKSTIAANLAIAVTQVGTPVVLIDADLRRPTQHEVFKIPNDVGLSTLLSQARRPWESVAVQLEAPNLLLIPSGPPPPDPADLLDHGLSQLIEEISAAGYFVLIDTPPILSAADALVIVNRVDGVIVICQEGRTRIDALRRAVSSLRPAGTRIVGFVLNQRSAANREQRYDSYEPVTSSSGKSGVAVEARSAVNDVGTSPPPARPSPSGSSVFSAWPGTRDDADPADGAWHTSIGAAPYSRRAANGAVSVTGEPVTTSQPEQ